MIKCNDTAVNNSWEVRTEMTRLWRLSSWAAKKLRSGLALSTYLWTKKLGLYKWSFYPWIAFFNLTLYPLISVCILYLVSVLYTFPKVLTRRICLRIMNFFSWLLFSLFPWPECVTQGWHCKKLDISYSQGSEG